MAKVKKLTKVEVKDQLGFLYKKYLKEEQTLLDNLTKEERIEIGHPIKDVSLLDSFTANGTKYIVRTSLTINRFTEFEKLQIRVGYGVDFRQMFANLGTAYGYLNGNEIRPADAAIMLHNIMNGVKTNLEERNNEVLDLCSLFICTEDEDVAKYDPDLNAKKIKDWTEEGIAMESFFTLAFNLVNGFIPIYQQVSESTLNHLEKAKEAVPDPPKRKRRSTRKGK